MRFDKLFDDAPDAYLVLSPHLDILRANKAYLAATLTTLAQIEGRHLFEIFPDNPNDPAAHSTRNLRLSLERVIATLKTDPMPIQKYDIPVPGAPRGTFEVRYWSPMNCPVLDDDGRLLCIIHRAEDVTAIMRLLPENASGKVFWEDHVHASIVAMYKSEQRYAGIIESAMDGIVTIDAGGAISLFNAKAEKMFGHASEEILGQPAAWLAPERLRAQQAEFLREFAASGQAHRMMGQGGEIVGLRKGGEEFPLEASISQTGEGDEKLFTLILRDISEKRRIESQFLRAQRMESIGRLAGGIAHDLNNILAPIMLSIGLLKSMVQEKNAREVLETIDVSARRGADIVQQVLSFARGIEGHQVQVQPKHLINDLLTMLKESMPKDIRIRTEFGEELWTVLGDPTQLHQVLLNLCVNARDAMKGGGQLTIGVQNVTLDQNYVAMNKQAKVGRFILLSVTDTGSGIPSEIMDKIFEPFFTTKELGKGTGLGLATVDAIAKSHGGFVTVYSEINKGTTFKIYLPAITGSSGDAAGLAEEMGVPRGDGELVLVVDDEASILAITSQTLQAFGYRVVTANNGAEAVAVYATRRGDVSVVITDMMMPVMDGPATILALMQIDPKVKIIAASGLDANGNVARAANAGITHFLKKPYTAQALLEQLRGILGK